MIFVTVGTHEQPFNRLVEYMDQLKENGIITEDVIIQTIRPVVTEPEVPEAADTTKTE